MKINKRTNLNIIGNCNLIFTKIGEKDLAY